LVGNWLVDHGPSSTPRRLRAAAADEAVDLCITSTDLALFTCIHSGDESSLYRPTV